MELPKLLFRFTAILETNFTVQLKVNRKSLIFEQLKTYINEAKNVW